jgi:hypothetical protein
VVEEEDDNLPAFETIPITNKGAVQKYFGQPLFKF